MTEVVQDSINALHSVAEIQKRLPLDWTRWFRANQVLLTGVGKSFDVARLGASLWQTVGLAASAVHATDLLHGGFGVVRPHRTTTLVLLSNSGRTHEILRVIDHVFRLEKSGNAVRTVAITRASDGNELAGLVSHALQYDCPVDGSRFGTIPSVSTTAQLAWLNIVACAVADQQHPEMLALGHPAGNLATVYERMPSE